MSAPVLLTATPVAPAPATPAGPAAAGTPADTADAFGSVLAALAGPITGGPATATSAAASTDGADDAATTDPADATETPADAMTDSLLDLAAGIPADVAAPAQPVAQQQPTVSPVASQPVTTTPLPQPGLGGQTTMPVVPTESATRAPVATTAARGPAVDGVTRSTLPSAPHTAHGVAGAGRHLPIGQTRTTPVVPQAETPVVPQAATPVAPASANAVPAGPGLVDSRTDTTQPVAPTVDNAAAAAAAAAVAPASAPAPVAAAAPTTPVAHTPALPETQPALAGALSHLRNRGDGSHELNVQLHPAELGSVHVRAVLHQGALTVTVACADDAARQAVTAALPDLHRQLSELAKLDARVERGFDLSAGTQQNQQHPGAQGQDAHGRETRDGQGRYGENLRSDLRGDAPLSAVHATGRTTTPVRPGVQDRLDRWM